MEEEEEEKDKNEEEAVVDAISKQWGQSTRAEMSRWGSLRDKRRVRNWETNFPYLNPPDSIHSQWNDVGTSMLVAQSDERYNK